MSSDRRTAPAGDREPDSGEAFLEVEGLSKYFSGNEGLFGPLTFEGEGLVPRPALDRQRVRAVDDVSFEIRQGETLGLVASPAAGSRRWPGPS